MSELTKIIGDCPHCTKPVELDQEKVDFVKREAEKKQLQNISANNQEQILEKPKVVEKIVEKIITKLPKIQPNYQCKDGRCGNLHPNQDYSIAPSAKCTNCGQFADNKTETCFWCKGTEFEEFSKEDREELGIPEPKLDEHHHNHEDE